ncbi:PP2C family protein-serine/threonine phosphatase [Cohnella lupini]|uniref:Protein phosphatase n=1 Tax=Cohnella lupini TaxID=1294267 RepID=A0A3D9IMK7_9BACL|nr:protein phosphatase 2C domain-containing protein [Cohnella lupini]RED63014.1 protein phosphatase [Cohnella lupini]
MNKRYWEYGISTDKGPYKQINEDSCFLRLESVGPKQDCALAVVADGMGGYGAGDQASQLAVDHVKAWWAERIHEVAALDNPHPLLNDEMLHVTRKINDELCGYSRSRSMTPGTTLSILIIIHSRYYLYHTGDSRIYVIAGQGSPEANDESPTRMRQLSMDHSWVAEEVRQGRLHSSMMNSHPRRNVLTHCLGIDESLELFQATGQVRLNDLFLLCSDGFYSIFQDEEILRNTKLYIQQYGRLQSVSDRLVQLACELGTTDNVSMVLIRARAEEQTKAKAFIRKLFKHKGS